MRFRGRKTELDLPTIATALFHTTFRMLGLICRRTTCMLLGGWFGASDDPHLRWYELVIWVMVVIADVLSIAIAAVHHIF